MVITNHQIVDGLQEDNRHKIATSSEIDGATCGGDLLPVCDPLAAFPPPWSVEESR